MDRLEVKDWLHRPVTRWVLDQALQRFPGKWMAASSMEEVQRLRGQREVLDFLATLPERSEYYKEK